MWTFTQYRKFRETIDGQSVTTVVQVLYLIEQMCVRIQIQLCHAKDYSLDIMNIDDTKKSIVCAFIISLTGISSDSNGSSQILYIASLWYLNTIVIITITINECMLFPECTLFTNYWIEIDFPTDKTSVLF